MAIAYYIPDQSKLIQSASLGSSGAAAPTTEATANSYPNQQQQTQQQQQQQYQSTSQNLIASIKIPLRSFCLNHLFCWSLVAQVFCFALRLCHHRTSTRTSSSSSSFSSSSTSSTSSSSSSSSSAGNNGVFRISLEISNFAQPEESTSTGTNLDFPSNRKN